MADEKTTVVETGGGGALLAFVFGALALLVVLYIVFGTNLLHTGTQKIDANVKVEAPSTK